MIDLTFPEYTTERKQKHGLEFPATLPIEAMDNSDEVNLVLGFECAPTEIIPASGALIMPDGQYYDVAWDEYECSAEQDLTVVRLYDIRLDEKDTNLLAAYVAFCVAPNMMLNFAIPRDRGFDLKRVEENLVPAFVALVGSSYALQEIYGLYYSTLHPGATFCYLV